MASRNWAARLRASSQCTRCCPLTAENVTENVHPALLLDYRALLKCFGGPRSAPRMPIM